MSEPVTLLLKPRHVVVEAVQVTEDNRDQIIEWINNNGGHAFPFGTRALTWVKKGGGIVDARITEWVVRDHHNNFAAIPDTQVYSHYERIVPVVSE